MTERRNYTLHIHGGDVLAVRRNGDTDPDLFVKAGETRNPRAMATADAVIYDAQLLDVYAEDGLVILQDPWAGMHERFAPSEWVDPSVAMFDRVDPVFADEEGDHAD